MIVETCQIKPQVLKINFMSMVIQGLLVIYYTTIYSKFKCNSHDTIFSSGSTIFGDTNNDTHQFTTLLVIET